MSILNYYSTSEEKFNGLSDYAFDLIDHQTKIRSYINSLKKQTSERFLVLQKQNNENATKLLALQKQNNDKTTELSTLKKQNNDKVAKLLIVKQQNLLLLNFISSSQSVQEAVKTLLTEIALVKNHNEELTKQLDKTQTELAIQIDENEQLEATLEEKPNCHQFFTEQSSHANQHITDAPLCIAKNH